MYNYINQKVVAYICVVAAFCYTIKNYTASLTGLSIYTITFYQMLFVSALSIFLSFFSLGKKKHPTLYFKEQSLSKNYCNIIILGVSHALMLVSLTKSIIDYGLSLAIPMFYCFPLFVNLIYKYKKFKINRSDIANVPYILGILLLIYSNKKLKVIDIYFTIIPALFYAFYLVYSNQYLNKMNVNLINYNTIIYGIGVIFTLLIDNKCFVLEQIPTSFIIMLPAAFCAYSLTTFSLKILHADLVSFILVLQMILSILIGLFINLEPINTIKTIGLLAITSAILIKFYFDVIMKNR